MSLTGLVPPYQPNCVNTEFDSKGLGFYGITRLENDACYQTVRERQSRSVGDYMVSNLYDCNEESKKIQKLSLDQPSVFYRDGYGWTGQNDSNIDHDSDVRNARNITNPRLIVRAQTRPYLTVPFMGRGQGDVCVESRLLTGDTDNERRPCNVLSGVSIDRFDPQVPCIKENVQHPKNIIQEDSQSDWVRGGQGSRTLIRNSDYLEKCGYEHNGKYWQKASANTVKVSRK